MSGVLAYVKRALERIVLHWMPQWRPCLRKARRLSGSRAYFSAAQLLRVSSWDGLAMKGHTYYTAVSFRISALDAWWKIVDSSLCPSESKPVSSNSHESLRLLYTRCGE